VTFAALFKVVVSIEVSENANSVEVLFMVVDVVAVVAASAGFESVEVSLSRVVGIIV
jgi:hypothetical protein